MGKRFCAVPRLAAVVALLALTQCGPPPPPYVTPASLTPQTAATVEGTDIPGRMVPSVLFGQQLLPDIKIGILQVDHAPAGSSGFAGSQSVLVSPGRHSIMFGAYYVPSLLSQDIAVITFTGDFAADKAYAVMSTQPQIGMFRVIHSQIWIEDSSGNDVTRMIQMTAALN